MIFTTTQGAYDNLALMNRMQEQSLISTLEQFEIDITQLKQNQSVNNYQLVSQGEFSGVISGFQQQLSMLQDTLSSMHLYIESLEARIESLESTAILEPLE